MVQAIFIQSLRHSDMREARPGKGQPKEAEGDQVSIQQLKKNRSEKNRPAAETSKHEPGKDSRRETKNEKIRLDKSHESLGGFNHLRFCFINPRRNIINVLSLKSSQSGTDDCSWRSLTYCQGISYKEAWGTYGIGANQFLPCPRTPIQTTSHVLNITSEIVSTYRYGRVRPFTYQNDPC